MRPINKGDCPKDENGNDKVVTDYKCWRKDLTSRIGAYCVYCNMPLSYNLQVEHVVPKKPKTGQTAGSLLAWENMLLACGPCNNAKTNKPSEASLHYLPEEHNTLLPFIAKEAITPDGKNAMLIAAAPGLSVSQQKKSSRNYRTI